MVHPAHDGTSEPETIELREARLLSHTLRLKASYYVLLDRDSQFIEFITQLPDILEEPNGETRLMMFIWAQHFQADKPIRHQKVYTDGPILNIGRYYHHPPR